jgi:hypothetical protein
MLCDEPALKQPQRHEDAAYAREPELIITANRK